MVCSSNIHKCLQDCMHVVFSQVCRGGTLNDHLCGLKFIFEDKFANLYEISSFHGTCDGISVTRTTDSLTFDRIHGTW